MKEARVLQLCHGYNGPFLDCARQYAALFKNTPYRVTTVYLTGAPDLEVERGSLSDEVIFLNYRSKDLRGLKLRAVHDVKHIVSGGDFHFCIAHRFKPISIGLLATKLPVIGVHHAFGVYKRLSRRLFAQMFRRRLALVAISDAVRDELRARLPKWPAQRIETLYNRIDVAAVQAEQLNREAARSALGIPMDAWVVGNVGRLHPDKDQATLVRGFARAFPQLPSGSLLVIMGSGRLESSLKALAAEMGIAERVRFLGQVPNGRRYFKAFDVFALTSDHEPFGMVLLEAMAAGVPLVCSDCGGGREVVKDVGRLFPLRDFGALGIQLVEVAKNPEAASSSSVAQMLARLQKDFSDESVRRVFWNLPMVSKLAQERVTSPNF